MRILATVTAAVATLTAVGTPTLADSGAAGPQSAPLAATSSSVTPPPAAQAVLDRVRQLAEAHPDVFGAAYYDAAAGRVVVRGRGARMNTLLAQATADADVAVRTDAAALTWDELMALFDRTLTVRLPGGARVYSATLDFENQRVVAETSSTSAAVRGELRAALGPNVAVRAGAPVARLSRNADVSPFFGGARIIQGIDQGGENFCTAAFPWRLGDGAAALLTAGHCVPVGDGWTWFTDATQVQPGNGSATYKVGGDWGATYAEGIGSVKVNTRTVANTGDVGQIRIVSGRTVAAFMYTGAWNSTSSAKITAQNPNPALNTTGLCEGGSRNGETCGWKIISTFTGYVDSRSGDTIRAVMAAQKSSATTCPAPGDSGAPVYVRNSTGITAMGILSGGVVSGSTCIMYFTSLNYAIGSLGGSLVTG
jgi:hypothetical protein